MTSICSYCYVWHWWPNYVFKSMRVNSIFVAQKLTYLSLQKQWLWTWRRRFENAYLEAGGWQAKCCMGWKMKGWSEIKRWRRNIKSFRRNYCISGGWGYIYKFVYPPRHPSPFWYDPVRMTMLYIHVIGTRKCKDRMSRVENKNLVKERHKMCELGSWVPTKYHAFQVPKPLFSQQVS